jgi:hypothetical protein
MFLQTKSGLDPKRALDGGDTGGLKAQQTRAPE